MFSRTENSTTANTGVQQNGNVSLAESLAEASGAKINNASRETNNWKPLVESMDFTVSSADGVGAATKTIYLFNTDFLNSSPTDNGSGAGSITYTYGDGYTGKVYNKMLENSFGAKGVKIGEIIAVAKTISTDVGDETFFTNANMKVVKPNGEGEDIPVFQIKWSKGMSNQPNKVGVYRMKINLVLDYLSQVKFSLSADTKVTLNFIPAEDQN